MTKSKRGKIKCEGRLFNPQGTNTYKYLFTVVTSKILCLVCRKVVSTLKENNLRRHFETNHLNLAEIDANEKSLKVKTLCTGLRFEQNFFKLRGSEGSISARVSFEVPRKIAATEKSFTEGELIKKRMLSAISLICPSEIKSRNEIKKF